MSFVSSSDNGIPEDQRICSFTLDSISDYLYFPDGNITLRSSGGVHFSVHKDVLSQASLFFRDLFSLPRTHDMEDNEIAIDEDEKILDKILRWMYPSGYAPDITSISEATLLLRAVEKLQIDCRSFDSAITTFLSQETHPLRAWALAESFSYPEALYAAARRFYQEIQMLPNESLNELKLVDGLKIARLFLAKKKEVEAAQAAIEKID